MAVEDTIRPRAKAAKLQIAELHPFSEHPFRVKDDAEMDALVESIRENGIYSPLIVRPDESGGYEVVSGHRRLYAAEKAGLTEVPALIYALSKEEAAIAVVDSNLHREHILPSEKAFAYKLKMDALSKQGKRSDLTSDQVGPKLSAEEISDTDSASQVKRYIRLTYLIPELLEMVDSGKIALTPAVELSYLSNQEQRDLLYTMQSEDCTPSLSQAQQLKKASQQGLLSMDVVFAIMSAPKANQQEKITFRLDELKGLFPKEYTPKDIYNAIVRLIFEEKERRERELKRQQRSRSRDAK